MYFVKFDPKMPLMDLMHVADFQVKAALNDQMNTIIIYLIYNDKYILTNIPFEAINADQLFNMNNANIGTIDGDISNIELFFDDIDKHTYEEILSIFDKVGLYYLSIRYPDK